MYAAIKQQSNLSLHQETQKLSQYVLHIYYVISRFPQNFSLSHQQNMQGPHSSNQVSEIITIQQLKYQLQDKSSCLYVPKIFREIYKSKSISHQILHTLLSLLEELYEEFMIYFQVLPEAEFMLVLNIIAVCLKLDQSPKFSYYSLKLNNIINKGNNSFYALEQDIAQIIREKVSRNLQLPVFKQLIKTGQSSQKKQIQNLLSIFLSEIMILSVKFPYVITENLHSILNLQPLPDFSKKLQQKLTLDYKKCKKARKKVKTLQNFTANLSTTSQGQIDSKVQPQIQIKKSKKPILKIIPIQNQQVEALKNKYKSIQRKYKNIFEEQQSPKLDQDCDSSILLQMYKNLEKIIKSQEYQNVFCSIQKDKFALIILMYIYEKIYQKIPHKNMKKLNGWLLISLSAMSAAIGHIHLSQIYFQKWKQFGKKVASNYQEISSNYDIFQSIYQNSEMFQTSYFYAKALQNNKNFPLKFHANSKLVILEVDCWLTILQSVYFFSTNNPICSLDELQCLTQFSLPKNLNKQNLYYTINFPENYQQSLLKFEPIQNGPYISLYNNAQKSSIRQIKQYELCSINLHQLRTNKSNIVKNLYTNYDSFSDQQLIINDKYQVTLKEQDLKKVQCELYGDHGTVINLSNISQKQLLNLFNLPIQSNFPYKSSVTKYLQKKQNSNYYLILTLENNEDIQWLIRNHKLFKVIFIVGGKQKIKKYYKNIYKFNYVEEFIKIGHKILQKQMKINMPYFNQPNLSFINSDKTKADQSRLNLQWILAPHNRKQSQQDFLSLLRLSENNSYNFKNLQTQIQKSIFLKKKSIIRWYTCDSFFYKIINRGLRSLSNPYHIPYIRYPVSELYRAIKSLYCQQFKAGKFSEQFICYRSCFLTTTQLNNLKLNINNYVQTQGFFSTSKNKQVTTNFGISQMIIQVPPPLSINGKGFANIKQHSYYINQQQILFNPLNYFKVISIQRHQNQDIITLQYVDVEQISNETQSGKDLLQYEYNSEKIYNQGDLLVWYGNIKGYFQYHVKKMCNSLEIRKFRYSSSSRPANIQQICTILQNNYKNILDLIVEKLPNHVKNKQDLIMNLTQRLVDIQYCCHENDSLIIASAYYYLFFKKKVKQSANILKMHKFITQNLLNNAVDEKKRIYLLKKLKMNEFLTKNLPVRLKPKQLELYRQRKKAQKPNNIEYRDYQSQILMKVSSNRITVDEIIKKNIIENLLQKRGFTSAIFIIIYQIFIQLIKEAQFQTIISIYEKYQFEIELRLRNYGIMRDQAEKFYIIVADSYQEINKINDAIRIYKKSSLFKNKSVISEDSSGDCSSQISQQQIKEQIMLKKQEMVCKLLWKNDQKALEKYLNSIQLSYQQKFAQKIKSLVKDYQQSQQKTQNDDLI